MQEHPITQTATISSPLLRLPAELRNKIYTHVFTGHEISVGLTNPGKKNIPYFRYRALHTDAAWSTRPFRFSLLSTCRQIHHETAHFRVLFYKSNAFRGYWLDLSHFTMRKGSLRPMIQHVRTLHYGCPSIARSDRVPVDVTTSLQCMLTSLAGLPGLRELVIIGPKRLYGHSPEFILGLVRELFGRARGGLPVVEIVLELLPTSLVNPLNDREEQNLRGPQAES